VSDDEIDALESRLRRLTILKTEDPVGYVRWVATEDTDDEGVEFSPGDLLPDGEGWVPVYPLNDSSAKAPAP
jgi:hypothetical protein